MASLDFKLDLDTSDLDVALEKTDRLRATLEAVKVLQAEVGGLPLNFNISGSAMDSSDIARLVRAETIKVLRNRDDRR